MICLICRQATVVEDSTSVEFERCEIHLTVNNVPARVCPSCGEAFVDELVARRLLLGAEQIYRAGMLEEVIDYESLQVNYSG